MVLQLLLPPYGDIKKENFSYRGEKKSCKNWQLLAIFVVAGFEETALGRTVGQPRTTTQLASLATT